MACWFLAQHNATLQLYASLRLGRVKSIRRWDADLERRQDVILLLRAEDEELVHGVVVRDDADLLTNLGTLDLVV